MTIRHLNIFVCVYREKGITAAAKKLYMAQPAVSQVIKEMETYYDVPLFDRISRKLYPTAQGQKLYRYAVDILSRCDNMEEAMRQETSNDVCIGTSITIGSHMLPGYVKRIKETYPHFNIGVRINSSETVEKMLTENVIDFGLIEGQVHSQNIHSEKFAVDRLVIICPPEHKITGLKKVTLSTLTEYPLLLREPGSGAREIFDYAMHIRGLSYEPAWESVSTQALVNGVKNGLGISVLPEKMVEEDVGKKNVSVVAVNEKSFLREYHIITHKHKHLSNAANSVIELIKAVENGTEPGSFTSLAANYNR